MERSAEHVLNSIDSHIIPERPSEQFSVRKEGREITFGEYLRRQRALRGISRDEIQRITKVSAKYIDALEANRFHDLPPKAFVVGFLRVLSKYAGLDETEVVNRFLVEQASQGGQESLLEKKEHLSLARLCVRRLKNIFTYLIK